MNSKPITKLRLYYAGDFPNSMEAKKNLSSFCQTVLKDSYELECLDIFEHGDQAVEDRVFMAPALVILEPTPVRHLFGNSIDFGAMVQCLGIQENPLRT